MTATWSNRKIGEIVESTVVGLVRNKESQGNSKEFIYVKMHNITPGNQLDLSNVVRVDATAEESEKYSLRNGDFLFNTRNSHELVGKSCIFRSEDVETVLFNNNIMRIRFRPEVDSRFVSYLFSTPEVSKQLEDIKSGTTNVSAIYYSSLQNVVIKYPPLSEQKRIVAILDKAFEGIDHAIANTEKNLTNARELFKGYLNAIFTQKGDGWVEKKLQDILLVQPRNGWSPPAQNHADSGTPVLTLSSVTGFQFDKGKVKFTNATTKKDAHYWLKNGEFLITRSNTTELVGHVAICEGLTEPIICCDLIMKMQIDPTQADARFIYWHFRTRALRDLISSSAQGANPTMKKINKSIVQNLPVVIPEISVQKDVVARIDAIATETQRLEAIYKQKLAALNELKQSILQKAFTGELTAETTHETMKAAEETIAA